MTTEPKKEEPGNLDEQVVGLIAGFPDMEPMYAFCKVHGVRYSALEPPYLTMARVAEYAKRAHT